MNKNGVRRHFVLTKLSINLILSQNGFQKPLIYKGLRDRGIRENRFFDNLNRTVFASPPVGGSGYGFARSIASLIPTQNLRHIFAALVLLRKPLFGLQKRRKQPERYAKFA
jgi:hypothetical protein